MVRLMVRLNLHDDQLGTDSASAAPKAFGSVSVNVAVHVSILMPDDGMG